MNTLVEVQADVSLRRLNNKMLLSLIKFIRKQGEYKDERAEDF